MSEEIKGRPDKDLGTYEVMDRISVISQNWEDYIEMHGVVTADERLREICEEVAMGMNNAYQLAANLYWEEAKDGYEMEEPSAS